MRVKMHKLFWAWDFDKEERWLNEMAAKGLHLVAVGFCTYHFEEGAPGEYAVRLEMLNDLPSNPASRRYIEFVEDTGAEYLGSMLSWSYFRKKRSQGDFDLFSDIDSRIRHLSRIMMVLGVVGFADLFYAGVNLFTYLFRVGYWGNLMVAIVAGAGAALLLYGFARVAHKQRRLKQDRILHE